MTPVLLSENDAGIDEAGRGALAGSVFAAAVILRNQPIAGLADSKTLSAKRREQLAQQIKEQALAYAIAQASVEEIAQYNILHATLLAMRRAICALPVQPEMAWIDGHIIPPELPIPARAIVKGDQRIAAISAASILAKTARDAAMRDLAQWYPQYGFERHSGYGTAAHLAALQTWGPCPEHRALFAPVRRAQASLCRNTPPQS